MAASVAALLGVAASCAQIFGVDGDYGLVEAGTPTDARPDATDAADASDALEAAACPSGCPCVIGPPDGWTLVGLAAAGQPCPAGYDAGGAFAEDPVADGAACVCGAAADCTMLDAACGTGTLFFDRNDAGSCSLGGIDIQSATDCVNLAATTLVDVTDVSLAPVAVTGGCEVTATSRTRGLTFGESGSLCWGQGKSVAGSLHGATCTPDDDAGGVLRCIVPSTDAAVDTPCPLDVFTVPHLVEVGTGDSPAVNIDCSGTCPCAVVCPGLLTLYTAQDCDDSTGTYLEVMAAMPDECTTTMGGTSFRSYGYDTADYTPSCITPPAAAPTVTFSTPTKLCCLE